MYTMKEEQQTVEALLTDNGKIIAIDTYENLHSIADEKIDLQGAFVYPGFIDNHMHMIGHGMKLLQLDLSQAKSPEEMLEKLTNAASKSIQENWFIGDGWNENQFSNRRIPSRYELDQICSTPMFLTRVCHHAALVNSSALELAGITRDTPDPADGVIVRDSEGEPTGYLLEGAQRLVQQHMPVPNVQLLTKALETSVDHLLSLGITGAVTDDLSYFGTYHAVFEAFNKVLGKKKKFRARLLRHAAVFQQMIVDQLHYHEPWIVPGEMKFFIDGALGAQTALLLEPYADAPHTHGVAVHPDEEIERLVRLARQHQEAIAVHVIGDAAVAKVLDAIEKHPVPTGKRDRLIHVNVLNEQLLARMAKLPIVLDIQPTFVVSDFPWVLERLGTERLSFAYAWKALLDRQFICGGGSDAPIEDPNPLLGIYAAITRRKPGEEHGGYLPEQKLSRYEAVSLFTTGSAATIGKEKERGQLAVGFDADFAILAKDLFQIEEEEIVSTPVIMTVVDGEIMYEKE